MSKTLFSNMAVSGYVDYESVVKELQRGLVPYQHISTFLKNPIHILSEYRTLRLGGSRQTGKTRFIVNNFDLNSVVLVKDHVLRRDIIERINMRSEFKDVDVSQHILTRHPDTSPLADKQITQIFVDDAGMYFWKHNIHKFYANVSEWAINLDGTIIYLVG